MVKITIVNVTKKEIDKMTQSQLDKLDKKIGISKSSESYQETADRLYDEGNDDVAKIYEWMEKRWFKID